MKILEHCCYRRYLSEWWSTCRHEGVWHLVHFGDHTLTELVDWFAMLCTGKQLPIITIAMPRISDDTARILMAMRYSKLNIITQSPRPSFIDTIAQSSSSLSSSLTWVTVHDLHTQLVTIRTAPVPNSSPVGSEPTAPVPNSSAVEPSSATPVSSDASQDNSRFITLSGGMPQAFSPGKYIVTVTITQPAYEAVQPQLDSWLRTYSKR